MTLKEALEIYRAKNRIDKWYECCIALESKEEMLKFRDELMKRKSPELMEWIKRACFYLSRDDFDSFLLYTEWDRPLKEKFWLPRRKQLLGVCKALQSLEDNELDELFLSMPPRTGKSTLINFFIVWVMLRDTERSNLYSSYADGVTTAFYNGIMEVLTDKITYKWQDIFPETIASQNAKELTLNLGRKKRYSSFTGRSLYGSLNGACDCDGYLVGDDLHSGIEEALNKDRLRTAWGRVDNNLLPRAKEGAKRLWIGTRWSQIDSIALRLDLLQNDNHFKDVRYRVINIPALNEDDESNFDYACGLGFSTEYYRQRRASFERNNDMASWFAQYMGQPIERAGAVFAPEDMRYFNGVIPDEIDRVFMAVDPAWGGGDFVASPVIFQCGNDLYIKDVVYDNGDKYTTQKLLAEAAKKYNVSYVVVEATKMTESYTEGIINECKKIGYKCNIQSSISHYTGKGKEQRIFDKAPDIREHMVFLSEGLRSKPYSLFMQNVFSFKIVGKNKNDDAPDSLAMAIDKAFYKEMPVIQVFKRVI